VRERDRDRKGETDRYIEREIDRVRQTDR